MSIINTGQSYKIIANGVTLDLFDDEVVKISNNITDLFDIGLLPSELSQEILLPGSKKNNQFFEHYYDISVVSPSSFTSNNKITCMIDFGGVYISQGYMKLNNITMVSGVVDSYSVTIYGQLSLFGLEINKKFLTDLTSLDSWDHELTYDNIVDSWDFNLFSGDIVYPMADNGNKIFYTNEKDGYGIDEVEGALCTQDFKPAIRSKLVFDYIFTEAGYTYESEFLDSGVLNNVYLLLNRYKKYPIIDDYDLEDFGKFKISPTLDSQNITLVNNTPSFLYWFNKEIDVSNLMDTGLTYTLPVQTKLRGEINLKFKITPTGAGDNAIPYFYLVMVGETHTYTTPLSTINKYFDTVRASNISQGVKTEMNEFTLLQSFTTPITLDQKYNFYIKYQAISGTNISITLDPTGSLESYLTINKLCNAGDFKTINVPKNMPFLTTGVKQLDFIKGIQQKFNLIIYPHKTKLKHFVIETFNDWYKKGVVKSFNNYINLDEKITVTPANNLSVNELTFGDKMDSDYVSKQFESLSNREYGTEKYIDDTNFYSQGEFLVETPFSSSPLTRIDKSGISGITTMRSYKISVADVFNRVYSPGGYSVQYYRIYVDLFNIFDISTINVDNDFYIYIKFKVTRYDYQSTTISYKTVGIPFRNGRSQDYYEYAKIISASSGYLKEEPQCITLVPSNISLMSTSPIVMC